MHGNSKMNLKYAKIKNFKWAQNFFRVDMVELEDYITRRKYTSDNPNFGLKTKKNICTSYQFIKIIEAADMSVVEEYLWHGVPARSFLRFGSSLRVVVKVDVNVFYAKLLHFILCSHAKRTASNRENNHSTFHGWSESKHRERRVFLRRILKRCNWQCNVQTSKWCVTGKGLEVGGGEGGGCYVLEI